MYKIFTEQQVKEIREALAAEKMQGFLTSAKEMPEGAVPFRMVITTEDVDRMGETISIDGWDISNYNNNPVVLWAHDYKGLPVGITTKLTKEGKKMIADGYFAPADANPLAGQLAKLYELGLLKTSSVGFIPTYDAKDKTKIVGAELLEWSFTPVPANPHALDVMKEAKLEVAAFKSLMADEKDGEGEEKGAVADQLTAEQIMEMKYTNLRAVWDVVYAFCDVYLQEEKTVDDFATLLSETAEILKTIADGGSVAGKSALSKQFEEIGALRLKGEALMTEARKTFMLSEGFETDEKAGRVLSEKNKNLIKSAVGKLDETSQVLKDLVASVESEAEPEEKAATHKQSGEVDGLKEAQKVLRSVATILQGSLRNVNEEIEKKVAKQ